MWRNFWPIIESKVIQKLQIEMSKIHQRQNNKITILKKHNIQFNAQQNTHAFPFFHRVKNLCNVEFSDEEHSLLKKGLQYNLGQKRKNWIENLALEAQTAISHLHISKQDHVRHLVANNLKHLKRSDMNKENRNNKYKTEWNIVENIKQKLESNNLIVTQAHKGKTIVILRKQIYEQYIQGFLNVNNFVPLPQDPTERFHKKIQTVVKKFNNVIHKQKCKYYNANPESPNIRALIKLHKDPIAIRPILNWTHAPAYHLAARVAFFLKYTLSLPNTFNVVNTTDLISDLKKIKLNQDSRMCSFDVVNMYTNVPTDIISSIMTEILGKLNT
jgi:hypothetical protein